MRPFFNSIGMTLMIHVTPNPLVWHIQENGHLKDIPSAEDVEENGVFLGEMDAKLLQKIEELTLYTIEQEKRIKNLEESNQKLIVLLEKLISEKQ